MRRYLQKIGAYNIGPDVLAILGAACIVRGAFLMHTVAGWMAMGIVLISAAVICAKGSEQD